MKKPPVVAILGRPNVGKSTLFNRIIRRRDAIVDDQPGVTRDRKYQIADWAGVEFMLTDTGGYVPGSQDVFEEAIRQQVHYALEEADLIVLVVDVVTGVTQMDAEIAKMLNRASRNVLLVVNKVDNLDREWDLGEFYQLGLGDPIAVSAIGGRNVGDFLDALVAALPIRKPFQERQDDAIRLAVIGKPNVGKSSLVNALLRQDKHIVTAIPGTTRDAIDTSLRFQERELVLIDTAGLRKRARVKEDIEYFSTVRTHNALRRCDVAIILMDATEILTDQDKTIIQNAIEAGKGLVVGINKWDLVEKETNTAHEYELEIQDAVRDFSFIPVVFISVITGQRVFRLLEMALTVYDEAQRKIQTADLNQFLVDVIEKNHPPAYGTKWIKINYVTQTRIHPPVFTFFTNDPRGIKQNYRNYLENQLRERFGFAGVPIRLHFRKKN